MLRDVLGDLISTRKMFGEYAVYAGRKTVALLCDDTLFVRQTAQTTSYLEATDHLPVAGKPHPKAKDHWQIDPDLWEDADWLAGLITLLAETLPPPKPKRRRAKS
ncbi:TfoX/Sxy family protein [Thioclava sp.]|uniref:TfoX/Sxy family protein n=1 Tax=Thioclava sp. TaxID=1933450 RepID=UPI003AA93069